MTGTCWTPARRNGTQILIFPTHKPKELVILKVPDFETSPPRRNQAIAGAVKS